MIRQREYSIAANVYAEALFRGARSQGSLQRVAEECKALGTILRATPRLLIFLENPQVATERKMELMDKVFKARLSPIMMRLANILIQRERVRSAPEILDRLVELVEQAEGIFPAAVATARELTFQDKLRLKTLLERFTQCRLRIDYEVQPDLIGGVVFQFRDVLIDGSLSSGLESIHRRLAQAQVLQPSAQ